MTDPANLDRADDHPVTVTMKVLRRIYLSGYGSGVATAVANLASGDADLDDATLTEMASAFARRECAKVEADPAVVAEFQRVIDLYVSDDPAPSHSTMIRAVIQ